jgi:hypothetical protein
VHDREVLLGDRAVVTEHLLDLGATARDVAQPTGREHRAPCEHDERRPPSRRPSKTAVLAATTRGANAKPATPIAT